MKKQIFKTLAITLVGIIVAITLLTSACTPKGSGTTSAVSPITTAKTFKMRMGTSFISGTALEVLNQKWIDKIQSETHNRVQITLYSANTLIDMMSSWDEMQAGVAEIANVLAGVGASPFTITDSSGLFYYGANLDTARQVWNQIWKDFPEISAEYSGAKRLAAFGQGDFYVITGKKPVRTLADFQGLQLSPTPALSELMSRLGATGTMLPMSEVYSGLDKGIIDGLFSPAEGLKSMNYAEVTRYSTNLHIVPPPSSGFYAMNLNTWNSLPPDIQKVFEDSIPWWESELDVIIKEQEQEAIKFAKAHGQEFIELSAEDQNKIFSILDEINIKKAAGLDAKGLPGTKIFQETRRLINEYNKSR
jgi:TRAP-type transport system periplasmic protein